MATAENMAGSSPDYKKLYEEAERGREEAKRGREEAERGCQEELERRRQAESAQQEALALTKKAEEAMRPTTLPELLDCCYENYEKSLGVYPAAFQSTSGSPANAATKVRPQRIKPWVDFPKLQEAIWRVLVKNDFMSKRHFDSRIYFQTSGKSIRRRPLGSERDVYWYLHYFNDQVSCVVKELYADPKLRKTFKLRGIVQFANHSDSLSVEETSPGQEPLETSRPSAYQFAMYNCSSVADASRVLAFTFEYRAPHKVTLKQICAGLQEMDIEEVITDKDDDGPSGECRRLVAAIIVQAYSYMIQAGVEYGCVQTGEATIFLNVPEDPRTVYYFLSVPKEDVGTSTGWTADDETTNRLHLTCLGQMIAFTLQALQTSPRSQSWKTQWLESLPRWRFIEKDIVYPIPANEVPSSDRRPGSGSLSAHSSPIQLRHRTDGEYSSRRPDPYGVTEEQSESDSNTTEPETPSMTSETTIEEKANEEETSEKHNTTKLKRGEVSSQRYCTSQCLAGLLRGGLLDPACPNVSQHGSEHHPLDQKSFLELLYSQLQRSMDDDFVVIGSPGSRGVPFAVRLDSYGYTFFAKCSPSELSQHLFHEARVYKRLRSLQGVHVPVFLGEIQLPRPYYYDGIAALSHAILLSFGGEPIYKHVTAHNIDELTAKVRTCVDAIDKLEIGHGDLRPANVLYDQRTGRVTLIDFERARKRKLLSHDYVSPEMAYFASELQDCVNRAQGIIKYRTTSAISKV